MSENEEQQPSEAEPEAMGEVQTDEEVIAHRR